MSRLIDGLAPHFGPMILQDFSFPQRGANLATRGGQYAVRIIGRQDGKSGLGTWEEDPEFRGDVSGFFYWQRESRPIGTWRQVMPVMRPFASTTESGPGLDQPAGGVPPDSRTPRDPPGGGPVTPSASDYAASGNEGSGNEQPGASGPGGGGGGHRPGGPQWGPPPDDWKDGNPPRADGGDPANPPAPPAGAGIPPEEGTGSTNSGRLQGDVGWSSDTGWEYGATDAPRTQEDVQGTSYDQGSIIWNPESGWEYGDGTDGNAGGDGAEGGDGEAGQQGDAGPNAPGKKSKPMYPEKARGVAFKPPQHFFLPLKGPNQDLDQSFAVSKPLVPHQNGQAAIPGIPGGMMGFILGSSDVDRQYDYWMSGDPRLFVAHRGNPAYGTMVCDIEGDSINNSVRASLQSVFRIVRKPRGDLSLQNGSHNVLAWNIGVTGQGESIGSMVADKSGAKTWLGMPSVRDGGPLDVTDGCKHKFGKSGAGEPISPLHMSSLTFWRNEFGEDQKDGPMLFEKGWPDPEDLIYPALVHLGWDEEMEYKWPRDSKTKQGTGAWRWWTSSVISFGGGDTEDPNPPVTPGGDDEEPGDPPTTPGGDGDPNPPTTPSSPGAPYDLHNNRRGAGSTDKDPGADGGSPPGGDPDLGGAGPEKGGSGGGGSSGGGGGGNGGGDGGKGPGYEGRVSAKSADGVLQPPTYRRRRRKPRLAWPRYQQQGNSGSMVPRPFGYTHVQLALPSLLAKPVRLEKGAEEMTTLRRPRDWNDWFDKAPLTLRMFAFGAQGGEIGGPYINSVSGGTVTGDAAPWVYTQPPGASRHRAGTATGGLAFGPPEIDPTDADDDYGPNGVTVSTPTFLALPGARFGAGSPEVASGGVRNGYTWREDGAGGLKFYRHDAAGGEALVLTLDSSGNATFVGDVRAASFDPTTAQTYTPSNVVTTRTYDADATSVAELADVLGSLIADLQTLKIID